MCDICNTIFNNLSSKIAVSGVNLGVVAEKFSPTGGTV